MRQHPFQFQKPFNPPAHYFIIYRARKEPIFFVFDMNQVIRLAETGLRLNPDPEFQPFGYFLLGDAYTALGDKSKAQAYLRKAEELQKRL